MTHAAAPTPMPPASAPHATRHSIPSVLLRGPAPTVSLQTGGSSSSSACSHSGLPRLARGHQLAHQRVQHGVQRVPNHMRGEAPVWQGSPAVVQAEAVALVVPYDVVHTPAGLVILDDQELRGGRRCGAASAPLPLPPSSTLGRSTGTQHTRQKHRHMARPAPEAGPPQSIIYVSRGAGQAGPPLIYSSHTASPTTGPPLSSPYHSTHPKLSPHRHAARGVPHLNQTLTLTRNPARPPPTPPPTTLPPLHPHPPALPHLSTLQM